jgi:hypothetical protein
MGTYVILDSNANLAESFTDEEEAWSWFRKLADAQPDEYALIVYDDSGYPEGRCFLA